MNDICVYIIHPYTQIFLRINYLSISCLTSVSFHISKWCSTMVSWYHSIQKWVLLTNSFCQMVNRIGGQSLCADFSTMPKYTCFSFLGGRLICLDNKWPLFILLCALSGGHHLVSGERDKGRWLQIQELNHSFSFSPSSPSNSPKVLALLSGAALSPPGLQPLLGSSAHVFSIFQWCFRNLAQPISHFLLGLWL